MDLELVYLPPWSAWPVGSPGLPVIGVGNEAWILDKRER